jgi:osmoprotectant transport system permease protein
MSGATVPVRRLLVGLALAGGAAAIGLPWLQVRPNRVVEGTGLFLFDSSPVAGAVVLLLWILPLFFVFKTSWRTRASTAGWAVGLIIPLVLLITAGMSAAVLAPADSMVRVSLSWGFWTSFLLGPAAALLLGEAAGLGRNVRLAGVFGFVGIFLAALLLGVFNGLSLLREYQTQAETFWAETRNHLVLSGVAVAAGTALGLVCGWGASRLKSFRKAVFFFLNLVQTLPSLALFGLMIVPLSALGVGGIGAAPALIVLSLYAAFPIARSTLTALENLDPAVLDAGRGLGMSRGQIFRGIQVPLALPVVLAGVRTASVQAVGNTVVAALIGAGGLGSLIFFGLGQYAPDLILLGTLPTLVLALGVEQAWALVLTLTNRRVR